MLIKFKMKCNNAKCNYLSNYPSNLYSITINSYIIFEFYIL